MGYNIFTYNSSSLKNNTKGNWIIPLNSTGTGTGVSTLKLTVSDTTTMYITGAGKFYTDAAGTLGESTTVTITSGASRTFYLKVTTGTSNIIIYRGNSCVTKLDEWTSSTNAANINLMNLNSIPFVMTYFFCAGNNTITGDLSNLSNIITYFNCQGNNTVTGDLSNLPTVMNTFLCTGSSVITGNLSSLPTVMTFFYCAGTNTITGNLSSLSSIITYFICYGYNTITGNLSSLPSVMTYFNCTGNNTITGNLSSLPTVMTYFNCYGSNTIQQYTGKTWANNMQRVYLRSNTATNLTAQMNDQLLIDLNNAGGTWSVEKIINLKGTRTTASDSAVASLVTKGVTVTVN